MGRMKSMEGDVGFCEVDAVFNGEPVELPEESTWTARLRRTRVRWFCVFWSLEMFFGKH